MDTGKGLVELTGRPDAVVFPDVCASCAARAAGQRLRIEKAFRRPVGDSSGYVVTGMEVPFCAACVAKHRAESPDPSLLRTTLTMFRSVAMLPAVGFVLIALFMLLPQADDPALFGFTVGFFLLGLACAWAAWRLSHRYRVREPSSVTSAFDFTDDSSGMLQRQRRTYRLANRTFGEAFAAANAELAR